MVDSDGTLVFLAAWDYHSPKLTRPYTSLIEDKLRHDGTSKPAEYGRQEGSQEGKNPSTFFGAGVGYLGPTRPNRPTRSIFSATTFAYDNFFASWHVYYVQIFVLCKRIACIMHLKQ